MKIKVDGMTCNHCVARVAKALETIQGIKNVNVSLDDKSAEFEKEDSVATAVVENIITEAGYKYLGEDK